MLPTPSPLISHQPTGVIVKHDLHNSSPIQLIHSSSKNEKVGFILLNFSLFSVKQKDNAIFVRPYTNDMQ